MLIFNETKFIRASFDNEEELEKVVIDNYEYLFGPSSIYLPKKLIKTYDGTGTIPDGFAIDLESKKWYIVEAELLVHSVWNHIAPQISKQIIASQNMASKRQILELSINEYNTNCVVKEKFQELGIKELNIRKVLGDILDTAPLIGLPIDNISEDLKRWARTLKNSVKLWQLRKFTEYKNPQNILYELPEEFEPDLDTENDPINSSENQSIKYYNITLLDLIKESILNINEKIFMSYKPRNGHRKTYTGIIDKNGDIELLGNKFSSPSYAALAGIQDAGSTRLTVNGWTSWKNDKGQRLADLREIYINRQRNKKS